MRKSKFFALLVLTGGVLMGMVSGCNSTSEGSLTKTEQEQFRAPLGQPMPAAAKADMEKMRAGTSAPAAPAKP